MDETKRKVIEEKVNNLNVDIKRTREGNTSGNPEA